MIGLADNGHAASHGTTAVIVGAHTVEGHRDSMLTHRWTRVVDAPNAVEADRAGYRAAAREYNATWN